MAVEEAVAGPRGPEGDRRWMIVDDAGRHVTQREVPGLALVATEPVEGSPGHVRFVDGPVAEPGGPEVTVTIWKDTVQAAQASAEVSAWISRRAGASLRLVHMPERTIRPVNPEYGRAGDAVSFADGYPFLVTTLASLAALNERLGEAVPMRRFRPNIVVEGAGAWSEDTWRRIRVGEVEFDIVKPCERCVVVDTDPATARRAKGVLRALAEFRRRDGKVYFGQNGIARTRGRIRMGDSVEVLETGPPRPDLGAGSGG